MVEIRCARPHLLWEPMARDIAEAYRAGAQIALLVPEQYTLQAERDLLRDLELPGFFRIDVLSPSRLEYRVFSAFGQSGRERIDERGKAVALTRVLQKEKDRLRFYAGAQEHPGFVRRMAQMLSTLKILGLSPERLREAADEARARGEEGSLWYKLEDSALILESYDRLLEGRFEDREDVALDMRARLAAGRLFEGRQVFVYGFDLLTEAFSQVLCVIAAQAERLHISIVSDSAQAEDGEAYRGVRESVLRLTESLKARGIAYAFEWYRPGEEKRPPDLAHLEKYLLSMLEPPFEAPCGHIRLYAGPTPYREVQRAAQLIVQEARRGVPLDDMMLLCGSLPLYGGLIESTCQSYGIPCYVADKLPLKSHRAVRCLLASLRCAAEGWQSDDVRELLKSGLSPLGEEEVWRIENYALRWGLRGRKWLSPLTRGAEAERAACEDLRSRLTEPVEALHRALAAAGTAAESLAALRAFISESGLAERAEALSVRLEAAGFHKEVAQLAQVFEQLDEMFAQMSALMGEERIPLRHFALWLENGLAERELSALPPQGGYLQAGQLGNLLPHRPRVVLALGLNDGILLAPESGLLTQEETEAAESAFHSDFGLDAQGREEMKQLDLLKALCAPSERLYLSYALADEEGQALRPLAQLKALERLFPLLVEEGGALAGRADDPLELPLAPMPALETLAVRLAAGRSDALWRGAWNWMGAEPLWRPRAEALMASMRGGEPAGSIGRERADRAFDVTTVSASRLETFASCPFMHFVDYGLRPARREEWAVESVDTGSFYHRAMDGFTRLAKADPSWPRVDRERAEALMDEALAPLVADWGEKPFYDTARLRKKSEGYLRVARRMAWMMTRGAAQSSLRPQSSELRFGDGAPGSLPGIVLELEDGSVAELRGTIDRLDAFEQGGLRYLRVVDYKSGSSKLNPEMVWEGAQIQLLIYLCAALGRFPEAVPAGAFYQHLGDPLIQEESEAAAEAELEKKLRLSGIILRDAQVISLMDAEGLTLGSLINADGSVTGKRRDLLEEDEIRALARFAKEKSRELAGRIKSGEIERLPLTMGAMRACRYCPHQGICRIDWQAGGRGKKLSPMSLAELAEQVRP